MTELGNYVINNLTKLKGSDYILIFIVSFFFIIGLYTFFKNIYKKLFETQAELIKLKEEIISNYKNLLEVSKSDSNEKEKLVNQLRTELNVFKTNESAINSKLSQVINNYIQLNSFTKMLKIAYNDMHMLLNVWGMLIYLLIIYHKKGTNDILIIENFNEQFKAIANDIGRVVDVAEYLKNNNDPFSVYQIPEKLKLFKNDKLEAEIFNYSEVITGLIDREIKILKR